MNKILFIGKDGWPIESIKGRPITNLIRKLIHTRRLLTYGTWLKRGGCRIEFGR